MALDITAQDIIIDETSGLTDDDINPALPPHDTNTTLQHLLTLGTALEVAYQADFVQATASAGETITSVVLTQDSSGTPFSETDGVLTDIQTVDGNFVWLFQDPNNADVVIGVIGTDDPTAEPDPTTDPLAFSFGLDHTSTTDADLYLVQYVALSHPDASDPDDQIDLTDLVYASIEGTSQISFSGANAAPGHHDFYLINSPDDASKQLLVIGLNGGTANVSTQGFGVDNQSINPNETLQVDFVTGGLLNAGSASQIQYGSHIETITEAGFTINQITPSSPDKRVDITIKAFDNTANQQGTDFFDGTTTDPVDITSIKLTGTSGFASTITVDGTYATGSGNVTVTGLSGTGNAVTITGLDNVTTVDITTADNMDRLTVTGVDANEGCDITEFHFKATTTNAHTEEVGSFINFDDDGPTAGLTEESATVLHDETAGVDASSDDQPLASLPGAFSGLGTAIGWAASASAVVTPSSSFGTDGPGTETLSLDVSAANADSGFDSLDGHNILLNVENGLVVGRVDANDDGSVDNTDTVAIAVSIDDNGILSIAQYIAIAHSDASDPDDVQTMNDGALLAVVDVDDGDDDSDSTSIAIGDKVQIRDDGPTVTADGTAPTLVTDDSELSDTASAGFAAAFTTDPGTDGDAVTYALDVKSAGVDSGLDDTLSGDNILLRVNASGQVEGYLENDTSTVAFLISVDENTGEVTLTQDRAVIHDDPTDPVESGVSAATLAAADLVTLTATATDGDGDTASDTANIGTAFTFEDDGPTITKPFDGDADAGNGTGTHETLANTLNASASGDFGYDIGADAHPAAFYDATHSDFVDQDLVTAGIQIGLTGSITGGGGGSILTPDVTLASETDASATFNFSFTYDKDPAAGVQTGTAGGTLVFDKVAGTYTITLTDPLEGFSFDVIHTAELLSKQPTSNVGHPPIVLEKLQADDPNTPADEDFYVQFTGNAINKANPFSLTNNGQGSSSDTSFNTPTGTHDMVSNNNPTWVSATQSTNGVAGDTIQKGELLTLRFFSSDVGIVNEATAPTAGAGAMAIKFDGIGNSEDLMLILNLVNDGADNIVGTADDTSITRAVYAANADIFKTGQVPAPYNTEFTLDNNDGLLIIERNDYNAAGEDYILQGVQIMQSGNGITGQAINLNGATGDTGGSNATGGLVAFDAVDNDVLKIVDIGFTSTVSETPDANLDFAFKVADADGDTTELQHILVDIA